MYQVRLEVGGPDLIAYQVDQNLDLVVYSDDQAPTILSATFTLRSPNGTVIVTDGAATVVSGQPNRVRYALTAAALGTTILPGDGWRGVWSLTIDGVVQKFTRDYAYCRYATRCPVTSEDLFDRHPSLRSELPDNQTNFAPQIRAAWKDVTGFLYTKARRPWLIVSTDALTGWVRAVAFMLIYGDARGGNKRYEDNFKRYEAEAEAYRGTNFEYDDDDDGTSDGVVSASPVISLSAGPGYSIVDIPGGYQWP